MQHIVNSNKFSLTPWVVKFHLDVKMIFVNIKLIKEVYLQ
jgi:hypothetical protein